MCRFWIEERRFKGPGSKCVVQQVGAAVGLLPCATDGKGMWQQLVCMLLMRARLLHVHCAASMHWNLFR